MTHRTLSIGGATYDLFVRLREGGIPESKEEIRLPLGAKVRVEEVVETCGGGASNSSVGLSRLGCEASFCGVVGSDQWGEKLLANLRREGVDVECATVVEGEVSSFSLILSRHGERVILYTPGTNEHLHDVTFHRDAAARADWIYVNRLQESSCEIEDDLIDILTGPSGPGCTWNPGGCHLESGIAAKGTRALLAHTDLLLLNREEALQFAASEDVPAALRTLAATGAGTIVVTDGKNGALGYDGARRTLYHCPVAPGTDVVDTTGAGDAFGVGATWALLHGQDLPTALRAGTLSAASVVEHVGAQAGLLTHSEMLRRLEAVALAVEVQALP